MVGPAAGPIVQQDNDGLEPFRVLEHLDVVVDRIHFGLEFQTDHAGRDHDRGGRFQGDANEAHLDAAKLLHHVGREQRLAVIQADDIGRQVFKGGSREMPGRRVCSHPWDDSRHSACAAVPASLHRIRGSRPLRTQNPSS